MPWKTEIAIWNHGIGVYHNIYIYVYLLYPTIRNIQILYIYIYMWCVCVCECQNCVWKLQSERLSFPWWNHYSLDVWVPNTAHLVANLLHELLVFHMVPDLEAHTGDKICWQHPLQFLGEESQELPRNVGVLLEFSTFLFLFPWSF